MSPDAEASPAAATSLAAQESPAEPKAGLLDKILKESHQPEPVRDMIGEFVRRVLEGNVTVSKSTKAMINTAIAQLDELLSDQISAVLHAEKFKELESSWRGLHYLVYQSETGEKMKIRTLNVRKQELIDDMAEATRFDTSTLWQKVYDEEYGMFGGYPFGLLVGDYEFNRDPDNMFLLEKISNVAAAAHAPFISAASPQLFGWDDFSQLRKYADLSLVFEGDQAIKWRSFRDTEDSRYVALCLPHILLRPPYGPGTIAQAKSFNFTEDVDGTVHSSYLWGNAAYALASRVTNSFAKYHWCSAIRGVQGGGLVEGLPVHVFTTDKGEIASKCPTEIAITDTREKEFSDLGFVALLHRKHTDEAAFFGGNSCQKPKEYGPRKPDANASAALSAQLPYILSTARFAHYIKSMMRDYIGAPMSRVQIEKFLNEWISNYVVADDEASLSVKAENPLREAQVEVLDVAGKPGTYKAVVNLKPHFMIDALKVTLRLVADLPPPTKRG